MSLADFDSYEDYYKWRSRDIDRREYRRLVVMGAARLGLFMMWILRARREVA